LEGALREVREEVGPDVQVRPLGTVHAYTFHYDDNVKFMASICYLMAYEGGQVQPGDDMQGSRYRWWSLEELGDDNVTIVVPTDRKWLFRRAIELYRLWNESQIDLRQLGLKPMG
jgi:ADP-ribose pyrophosphatase YjhB (NUDIX family)